PIFAQPASAGQFAPEKYATTGPSGWVGTANGGDCKRLRNFPPTDIETTPGRTDSVAILMESEETTNTVAP
ncbi:MAG: hypothetical protein WA604_15030, partial [Candidatus Sulfotelmatobacter sp.]